MSKIDSTALSIELEKNNQFCLGLKSLISSGCNKEIIDDLLEQLCDKSEYLASKFS
jgi:hypothetical protein